MPTIAQYVHAARLAASLSQAQLAQRVGVAQAAISRIERGETKDPGVFILARIALALGLSVDAIIAGNVTLRPVRPTLEERVAALERAAQVCQSRRAEN